jgi:hypothetical protein
MGSTLCSSLELGNHLRICLKVKKLREKPVSKCRLQDLQDEYGLSASISASNEHGRFPNVCAVALLIT